MPDFKIIILFKKFKDIYQSDIKYAYLSVKNMYLLITRLRGRGAVLVFACGL